MLTSKVTSHIYISFINFCLSDKPIAITETNNFLMECMQVTLGVKKASRYTNCFKVYNSFLR